MKLDERSVARSKTPKKSERPVKKKAFPKNFKKFETFFYKSPAINPGLKKFNSGK